MSKDASRNGSSLRKIAPFLAEMTPTCVLTSPFAAVSSVFPLSYFLLYCQQKQDYDGSTLGTFSCGNQSKEGLQVEILEITANPGKEENLVKYCSPKSVESSWRFIWVPSGLPGAMRQNGETGQQGVQNTTMNLRRVILLFASKWSLVLHHIAMLKSKGRHAKRSQKRSAGRA